MKTSGSETDILDLTLNKHAISVSGYNLPGEHTFRSTSGEPIEIRFIVFKKRVDFEFKNYSWELWEETYKFRKQILQSESATQLEFISSKSTM